MKTVESDPATTAKTSPLIRRTQKKIGSRALSVAIVAALILILLGYKAIAKGLILGTLFSIINFVIIGEFIPLMMAKKRNRAFLLSSGSLLMRFVLMSIPLILAIKSAGLNFAAVVVGLFMVQLMILADAIMGKTR